jgi:hypothetical protein
MFRFFDQHDAEQVILDGNRDRDQQPFSKHHFRIILDPRLDLQP